MLVVIAEDIGSARAFWINVLNNTIGQNNYIISDKYINKSGSLVKEVNGGKDTLQPKINYVFNNNIINKGDTLFIIFDNIGENFSYDISSYTFIDNLSKKCENNNIKAITTSYYCFEEIYLSHTDTISMYKNLVSADMNIIKVLDYIYNNINLNNDYFDTSNTLIKNAIISMNKDIDSICNREKFAAALLEYITHKFYRNFYVTKKNTGFECYLLCCNELRSMFIQDIALTNNKKGKRYDEEQVRAYINRECNNKCTYCCKNTTALVKIDDVFKNSILSQAEYTYTDFNNKL